MTDLVSLIAQLDEDEAAAKAATPGPWAWEPTGEKDNSWAVGLVQDEDGGDLSGRLEPGQGVVIDGVCESISGHLPDADHIARQNPARTLRRIAAYRLIIAELTADPQADDRYHSAITFAVECIATEYSDHPDYPAGMGA